jgi:hypothetical protein
MLGALTFQKDPSCSKTAFHLFFNLFCGTARHSNLIFSEEGVFLGDFDRPSIVGCFCVFLALVCCATTSDISHTAKLIHNKKTSAIAIINLRRWLLANSALALVSNS